MKKCLNGSTWLWLKFTVLDEFCWSPRDGKAKSRCKAELMVAKLKVEKVEQIKVDIIK